MTPTADNRRPVCRTALWAPAAEPVGRKTCPRCGADLWTLGGPENPLFFPRRPGETERGFLAALAGAVYGTPAEEMEAALQDADSLDLVEIVLEVEEALRGARR